MKKDEFASLNTNKKHGTAAVILIAVIALCLAGLLYAGKLKADSSSVTTVSYTHLTKRRNSG